VRERGSPCDVARGIEDGCLVAATQLAVRKMGSLCEEKVARAMEDSGLVVTVSRTFACVAQHLRDPSNVSHSTTDANPRTGSNGISVNLHLHV